MIRALIFDFDGLILETEGPSYQSWAEVYASFGHPLPFTTWATIIGTSRGIFDPQEELQKLVQDDEVDWVSVEARRIASEREILFSQPILPGVEQYLQEARRLRLKIGLASSSSCRWVVGHLVRLGLIDYFDCIRASDDVREVKPDPEVYQAVLDGLDVNASETLALEDSPIGIRAAKGAGCYCVAVPNALTRVLDLSQADLQLSSLAEMPLEQLLARFYGD